MNTNYNTAVRTYLDQTDEGVPIPDPSSSHHRDGHWRFYDENKRFLGKLSDSTGKLSGALKNIQVGDKFTPGLDIRKHGWYFDVVEVIDVAMTEVWPEKFFRLITIRYHSDGTPAHQGASFVREEEVWLNDSKRILSDDDMKQAEAELMARQAEYDKQFEEWNKGEVSQ